MLSLALTNRLLLPHISTSVKFYHSDFPQSLGAAQISEELLDILFLEHLGTDSAFVLRGDNSGIILLYLSTEPSGICAMIEWLPNSELCP